MGLQEPWGLWPVVSRFIVVACWEICDFSTGMGSSYTIHILEVSPIWRLANQEQCNNEGRGKWRPQHQQVLDWDTHSMQYNASVYIKREWKVTEVISEPQIKRVQLVSGINTAHDTPEIDIHREKYNITTPCFLKKKTRWKYSIDINGSQCSLVS